MNGDEKKNKKNHHHNITMMRDGVDEHFWRKKSGVIVMANGELLKKKNRVFDVINNTGFIVCDV